MLGVLLMIASIWIEPHERHEAIEAYRARLSDAQVTMIEEAPETALIKLRVRDGETSLMIVEEG